MQKAQENGILCGLNIPVFGQITGSTEKVCKLEYTDGIISCFLTGFVTAFFLQYTSKRVILIIE